MYLLAMDTATRMMGVALLLDGKLKGEFVTNLERNHSVALMPAVQGLLRELSVSPRELDAIAVGQGPGSYTGVRIGVATAKAMAWALQIPLVGISTLQAMAMDSGLYRGWVCPLIDARRGRAYTGLYRLEQGRPKVALEERVVALEEWVQLLQSCTAEEIFFVGEDVELHRDWLGRKLGGQCRVVPAPRGLPRPVWVGDLGWERWHRGEVCRPEELHAFVPAYLQKTQAEQGVGGAGG